MTEESAQAVNWKECRAFQEDCKRERKEDIAAVYEAQRRSSSELAAEQREFNKALIQRVDNTISALSTQVGRLASSVAKLEGWREGKLEVAVAHADGVEEGENRQKVKLTESGNFKTVNRFFSGISWQTALKGAVMTAIVVGGIIAGYIVGHSHKVAVLDTPPIKTPEK